MFWINIVNFYNYNLPDNLCLYFQKIYCFISDYFSLPNYEIEIAIVNEEEIRELNFSYRGIDLSTDVLSFSFLPNKFEKFLGAIYFCFPVINKNNNNLLYEFCFLFVHSFLHLLGYEHGEDMFNLQNRFIREFF